MPNSVESRGDQQGRERRTDGVDLIVGGFPCQDLSVAGKRAGLKGERSGLFWEIVRIAKEIRPTWGLFENVPGLLSSHYGRDFWLVLSGLRECWPAVGYRVLDSQFFGVAQRRRRVFIVCGPGERSVASVLFEPESGGGDSQTSKEAGAGVAAAVGASVAGTLGSQSGGFRTTDLDGSGAFIVDMQNAREVEMVGTLQGEGLARSNRGFTVTHPLKAEGADASEDGTGRGVSMVTFDPTTSLDQAPNSETFPPLKIGTGLESMPWAPAFQRGAMVRRLTCVECERLQGFPDGWTDVPGSSDSTRYRQLGNAITVNVAEWFGRRLHNVGVPT